MLSTLFAVYAKAKQQGVEFPANTKQFLYEVLIINGYSMTSKKLILELYEIHKLECNELNITKDKQDLLFILSLSNVNIYKYINSEKYKLIRFDLDEIIEILAENKTFDLKHYNIQEWQDSFVFSSKCILSKFIDKQLIQKT